MAKRLTLFYSWQSDSPSNLNRSFIEKVLQEALNRLKSDATLENALRDRVVELDNLLKRPSSPRTSPPFKVSHDAAGFEKPEGLGLRQPSAALETRHAHESAGGPAHSKTLSRHFHTSLYSARRSLRTATIARAAGRGLPALPFVPTGQPDNRVVCVKFSNLVFRFMVATR